MPFLALTLYSNDTAIDFSDITYDLALEYAAEENKLVFVNFNAQEVIPCQVMASTTYQDKEVISVMNKFYINVNADVEQEIGGKWIDRFNIECLPTVMILDPNGKLIGINQGNLSKAAFIRWLGLIGAPNRLDLYANVQKSDDGSSPNLLGIKKKYMEEEKPSLIPVDNNEEVEIKILSPFPSSKVSYLDKNIARSKTKIVENSFSFSPYVDGEKLFDRVPLPKEPHLVKNSEAHSMSYSIQIGAFEKYLNAKKYIEKSSENLDSHYYILEEHTAEGKSLYKVVVGAFTSKNEAKKIQIRLEELGYNGFIRRI